MSQLSSKLANSVRQAKAQQKDDPSASETQTEESPGTEAPAPASTAKPKAPPARQASTPSKVAEEPPLPKMPSRRVWPD